MKLLEATSLTIGNGTNLLCRGLDMEVNSGERWGILGSNGIGKTSLLLALAGLKDIVAGAISIEDKNITHWDRKKLSTRVGMMFQDSYDSFPVTVMETALCGRHPHLPFWAVEGKDEFELVNKTLEEVSLKDMAYRQVNSLSGGERRRLAIATLLVQEPKLSFLDEPTNHLDLNHQISMLELLCRRNNLKDGALIMVLHDVNLVTRFCTHVGLMIDADTFIQGSVDEVINEENLVRVYDHPVYEMTSGEMRYFIPG